MGGTRIDQVVEALRRQFGEKILEVLPPQPLDPVVRVDAADLPAIAAYLKDSQGFDYFLSVTGVDYPPERIDVVYHLSSIDPGDKLVLKVRVPRDNPEVPSVTPLWKAANWQEREAYDLMGIIFKGHPDLRRIFLTEEVGVKGHPLRKDWTDETGHTIPRPEE
ncbi:MAG: NADH-quinone oxidoreductase subunit C [Nitrospirae bacterium]|nr:NADH-quinone oxidoreductase subunit C [Nitrospirota bacterium]